MGSDRIVQAPPLLDEDNGLRQRVEDLAVQELVPQLAVEALVVAVLPRTARFDEERLHTESGQPSPHELRRELRPVVRAQMLGRAVAHEQVGEHFDHIMGSSPSSDLDRQTLSRVFVEHGEKLQRTTVVGPCAHEVIRPDMILVQRPESYAGPVVEPQPTSFRLPTGHFEPLLPPDPLHALVVHLPAFDAQHVRDLAIPVATEPARQPNHVRT